jgi:hypothetical protein
MFNPFQSEPPLNIDFILRHPLSIVFCILGIFYCFFVEKHINYEQIGLPFQVPLKIRAGVTAAFLFALIPQFTCMAGRNLI